ncbi:unnamed protein product [Haemonchus placei]|uniref:Hyaluronidase n=1 Tax=Haemonchus placei TaxID=6290 RepID=A0A0N4VSH3_HAEPC|nr:unnamed protein product [Haemonchus placei]
MNYSGDKVALFHEFTFGRYPYNYNYSISDPINFGTPQNVTQDGMAEHLRIAEISITSTIQGVDDTTLAVVDFEEWRPLFRQNGGRKKVYQETAEALVKQAHSNYTKQQVRKTATEEYNAAAKEFILKTLVKARELRPNASWGMYGFPYCNYDAGTKDNNYECSPLYQQFNDDIVQNVTTQYYVPEPFNITEILNFNDTCSTFNVPVTTIQQYGNLCNAYWNSFTRHCKCNITTVLEAHGIQDNADHNFTGEKVALFYEFTFGRYPYYKNYELGNPINNGTPQNLTQDALDEHIRVAIQNITTHIKYSNSSGLGIIDFEEWRPLFITNCMKKQVYKDAAVLITNLTLQTTNVTLLNKTAEEKYEKAARLFIETTLRNATQIRNKTLWGMYGFPYCNYDAGKNVTDFRCMDRYKTFNDRMEYIFNASQALYPSIYLNNKTDYHRNFRYVQAIMAETLRVARNYSRHLPIYVYTKFEYDPLNQLCSFYTRPDSQSAQFHLAHFSKFQEDLCSTIVLPYKMGADGLIFWSSSSNMTKRCDIVTKFVNTTLGPYEMLLNQIIPIARSLSCTYSSRAVKPMPIGLPL